MSASHDIIIEQYHADNGIFRANAWVQDCQERSNTHITTYYGLGAHHNNGLAERRVRYIQDNDRAMILYAQQKIPEAITAYLWPYSLRHANNSYSATSLLALPQILSPLQLFTGYQFQDNPHQCHPFGCPTYVLNEALRSSHWIHHKWKTRSKVVVYLGRSPLHNHDIALVLNRNSGLVIPQFHMHYDPPFTTTKDFDSSSFFQVRAGFVWRVGHTISRADR